MPRVQIPPKLAPLQKPKRYKILVGGRGSAKSMTLGDLSLVEAAALGHKFGCFREYQNSIDESVYSLLVAEIDRLEAPGFDVQARAINHASGGGYRFAGLARNAESIKSMYGFNRFMVEEAQTISHKSLKLLTPTLRVAGSEIWMAANPLSRADPFSQRFIVPYEKELDRHGIYEDDLHTIIRINYDDNPWFPDVLEQERLNDKATLSAAEYEHIWLGRYNDTVENAIIPVEWFDAAIDAHEKLGFKPLGAKIAAHDPSDLGRDDKGYVLRHGSVVLDVQVKDDGDVNEGMDWALDLALQAGADWFTWDCDGLGVSLRRQVVDALDGKAIDYEMFKGSEGVEDPDQIYQANDERGSQRAKTNKETFRNRRAQRYWRLRDRFLTTYEAVERGEYRDPQDMISLSSGIQCLDELRSEVCRIPLKPTGNGLIQIMNKQEMEKLEIPSPNMADSLMMSQMIPKVRTQAVYVPPPTPYRPRFHAR